MEHNHDMGGYWKQWKPAMDRVYGVKMASWISSVNLAYAFVLKDRHARCIDDRTPGGVHLAGGGILLPADEAAKILVAAGADGVYSHEDCGAAKRADRDAEKFAREVAAKAGIPYLGHQSLYGPHIARVTYVDGTGRFSQIPELPSGFTVSWRYTHPLNKDYARQEVTISSEIALSNHCFGELFTKDEPFLIVPIGDPYDKRFSLDALTAGLKDVAKPFDGRVVIDGFTAPKY